MKLEVLDDLAAFAPGAERTQRWDALVDATEEVDDFCSSSRWVLPAHRAFFPEGHLLLGENEAGAALLLEREHPSFRTIVHPLEAMWGFATGVAGPDLVPTVVALAEALLERGGVGMALLPGLPSDETFTQRLIEGLAGKGQLLLGPLTGRARASLEGGQEGFLSRRGAGLRRTLERARKKAETTGVEFTSVRTDAENGASWAELYQRIQGIEARSWKGQMHLGIGEDPMRSFYGWMGERLQPEGSLRVLFASRAGEDLAYHFGGVHAGVYRGLQHAYIDEARQDGLGNLTHLEMISRIAEEGISTYDLGQEIDYKRRWAENRLFTRAFYFVPRP